MKNIIFIAFLLFLSFDVFAYASSTTRSYGNGTYGTVYSDGSSSTTRTYGNDTYGTVYSDGSSGNDTYGSTYY